MVQRKPKIAAKKVKRKSAVRRKTVPIVRRKIAQHVNTNASINVLMNQQIQLRSRKYLIDIKERGELISSPLLLFKMARNLLSME